MTETARKLVEDYERNAPLFSRDAAMERYRRGADRLIKMIRKGAKSKGDVVWKNTCDLLIAGSARLFVLSPRHDSAEIVEKETGNPKAKFRVYFGGDSRVSLESDTSAPPIPNYDQYMIFEEDDHAKAKPGEMKITISDPWRFPENEENVLKQEVIHEVQHIVSHRPRTSPQDEYKEEFTAYAVSGFKGDQSKEPVVLSDGTQINGLDNPLQFAIFKQLYYQHTNVNREMNSKAGAVLNRILGEKTFWEVVQEFKAPSGINLVNSLYIDNLAVALLRDPPDMKAAHRAMHYLKDRPGDIAAIQSQEPAWREIIFSAHPEETAIIAGELFPKNSLK